MASQAACRRRRRKRSGRLEAYCARIILAILILALDLRAPESKYGQVKEFGRGSHDVVVGEVV